jgi:hypothetical protein
MFRRYERSAGEAPVSGHTACAPQAVNVAIMPQANMPQANIEQTSVEQRKTEYRNIEQTNIFEKQNCAR